MNYFPVIQTYSPLVRLRVFFDNPNINMARIDEKCTANLAEISDLLDCSYTSCKKICIEIVHLQLTRNDNYKFNYK